MVQVGSMYAQLSMEDASFKSGMANAQKQLNQLSYQAKKTGQEVGAGMSRIERSVSGMTSTLKTAAGSFIGAFAVGSLATMVQEGLNYASSLAEVAQQLGVTTDTLQEYRFVATQVGIEQADMDASLAKLTRTIGDADMGAKSQAAAFRMLGIATRDANGNLKTTDQILPELVRAFSEIKDPATRAALQVDIFGKSGQKLDTLLSGGVDQVDNLRNAAHRLGAVISPDLIARADEAADKMAALQQVLQAQIAGVVAENANAILAMADAIATAANSVGTFFSNMKGVERIQKYEGWSKGFFASWEEQKMASTDRGYGQRLLQQQLNIQDRLIKARNAYREDPTAARGRGVMRLVEQLKEATDRLNRFSADLEAAKAGATTSLATTAPRVVSPRVSSGGGGGRSRGGSRAPERDKLGDDLSALLERIKPEDLRALEQYTADQELLKQALDKGRLSAIEYDKALAQLADRFVEQRFGKTGPAVPEITAEEAFGDFIKPTTFEEIADVAEKEWKKIALKNDELAESFMVMAQRINSDLRSLVDGIKSGDFFDIIDGVVGLFGSLSQTGVFGSGLQNTFSNAPSWSFGGFRANGGPVAAGRAYVVGERGPELFLPNMRGMVLPDLNSYASGGWVGDRGRSQDRGQRPVVVQLMMEESANLLPTIRTVSSGVTVEHMTATARQQARRASRRTG